MKKIFVLGLIMSLIVSCSKDTDENPPVEKKIVEVYLDFSFNEIGDLSKSTSSSFYTEFYNNYIKTKKITPKTYDLTILNIETEDKSYIKGSWDNNEILKLPMGEYRITGTSHPATTERVDSLYLSFDNKIVIEENTKIINLIPEYNCYMLILEPTTYDAVSISFPRSTSSGTTSASLEPVIDLGGYRYSFLKNTYGKINLYYKYNENMNIHESYTMNCSLFEFGKYYFFDRVTGSFEIPPMEEGKF